MIKLKNILADNIRQIATKNLSEDSDQNNNGFPDNTEVLEPEKETDTDIKQPKRKRRELIKPSTAPDTAPKGNIPADEKYFLNKITQRFLQLTDG